MKVMGVFSQTGGMNVIVATGNKMSTIQVHVLVQPHEVVISSVIVYCPDVLTVSNISYGPPPDRGVGGGAEGVTVQFLVRMLHGGI
jgi:hypothetical protein